MIFLWVVTKLFLLIDELKNLIFQRARLEKFLQEKKLLGTDPFVDEDFEKLSELGAGNGGIPFASNLFQYCPFCYDIYVMYGTG